MAHQHQVRVGPVTNTQAPFTPDMVLGWHADSPRLENRTARREGWSVSQTTHIQAPFSIEMLAGARPDRPMGFVRPPGDWMLSQAMHGTAIIVVTGLDGLTTMLCLTGIGH